MKYELLIETRGLPDAEKIEKFGLDKKEPAICFTYMIGDQMLMAKFNYAAHKREGIQASGREQLTDQFIDLEPEAYDISTLFFMDVASGELTFTAEEGELKDKPTIAVKPNYMEQMLLARARRMGRKSGKRKKRA